jgi:lysophospholipase L1-like esterase
MRHFAQATLLIFTSVLVTLCVIEILFRFTGLATDTPWAQGDKLLGFSFVPNQTGTTVLGKWAEYKVPFHINSDGWNAIRNYTAKPETGVTRIAVIGDSYVEALNVAPSSAMASVLERNLLQTGRKIEVYPFGISSSSASHYLDMMRYVKSRFSPNLYVITVVHNDIQDSLSDNPHRAIYFSIRRNGTSFEEVPPKIYQPSLVRRAIGHLAIARYVYINLNLMWNLRADQNARFEANIDVTKMLEPDQTKEIARYVFTKYLEEVDGNRKKLVLLMDTVRAPIYEGLHPKTAKAFQYNTDLASVCSELTLYCLDLTDDFWSDFQKHKRRFNSVTDGHWNDYGHQVVANALERYLLENDLLRIKESEKDVHPY